MEVLKARWVGTNDRDDPEEIVQHGIRYRKGEWTDVPFDKENELHRARKTKLIGHPHFEVKGVKAGAEEVLAGLPAASPAPRRAPETTYMIRGSKKEGYWVVDDNGHRVQPDEPPYKTAEDAQTVADALNAPKP